MVCVRSSSYVKLFLPVFAILVLSNAAIATAAFNVVSDSTSLSYRNTIAQAADRLVALQYSNGSWDWDVTGQTSPTGTTYLNIAGVTAEGLLDAYKLTGNTAYLDAAKKAGDYLVAQIGTPSASQRQNAYNIVFLYHLATVTGDTSYSAEAKAIFDHITTQDNYWSHNYGSFCTSSGCTAAQLLAAYKNYRGGAVDGVTAWDLAPFVEAAHLSGNDAFATDVANAINTSLSDSGYTESADSDYELELAAGVRALNYYNANCGGSSIDYSRLLANLVAKQNGTDGHFASITDSAETAQYSAYALMALKETGDSHAAAAAQFLQSSFGYTHSSADFNGWVDDRGTLDEAEYSEVTSEAAQALFDYIYSSGTYYTIQDAINAAGSDGTISVAAGTYPETVTINKPLTMVGTGVSKPVISGNSSADYIVKVDGTNSVILDNLEINGGGSDTGANNFDYGVLVTGSGTDYSSPVEIENSVVKNIWASSSNGIGVESSSYALVHDNNISSFQKRGIRFIDSQGKFYDNEVIGDNVDGTSRVQNLVNLWGGSNVEIYGNKLRNALTTGTTPTWSSPGIFVSSYGGTGSSYANIHDNEIYSCDTGITLTSVYADPDDASSADITSNNFHDLDTAINFEQSSATATIHGNNFTSVNKAVDADPGTGLMDSPPSVNAAQNYWGTSVKSQVAALIYNGVDFDPYYVDSSMTTLSNVPPTVSAGPDKVANAQFMQDATASAPSGIVNYTWTQLSGPGTVTFGTPNAEGTTISADTDGTYVLQLAVTDNADNTASSSMTLIWDTTPPTFNPSSATSGPLKAGSLFELNFTASESLASDPIVTIGGQPASKTSSSGSTYTYDRPLDGTETEGSAAVSVTGTDLAGNTATNTFASVSTDFTAPVISGVPSDFSVEVTSSAGATVTYDAPSATNNHDPTVTVSCAPDSGSIVGIGNTTVSCTSTDTAGNTGTASFTVTVQDTTAPTIDAVSSIVAEATSAAGASVTITPPMSHDAVDGNVASTCDKSTGVFPLGTTTVTCTKTDAAGNAATPSVFTVTVQYTSLSLASASGCYQESATAPNQDGTDGNCGLNYSGQTAYSGGAYGEITDGDWSTFLGVNGQTYTVTYDKPNAIVNSSVYSIKYSDPGGVIRNLNLPVDPSCLSSPSLTITNSFSDYTSSIYCQNSSGNVLLYSYTAPYTSYSYLYDEAVYWNLNQTISFASLPNVTYGASDFAADATATSGLPVSYSATGNCAVTGDTVSITGAGSCTITASQAGDGDYNAAENVSRTFAIGTKAITATADAKAKVYGAADPALTYTLNDSLVGTDSLSGSLARDSGENVGAYAINQSTLAASSNYDLTYVSGTLAVNKATATITPDNKTKSYGGTDPALTYTSSGFVNGDNSGILAGSLSRATGEGLGAYAITGNFSAGSNYNISYAPAYLTISAASVSSNNSQVVLSNSSTDSTIDLSSSSTNVTLDVSSVYDNSTFNATIAGAVTVNASTSLGNVMVEIPANVTITGDSDWNGTLTLPHVMASPTVSPPTPTGFSAPTIGSVVEVGLPSVQLNFSSAVRIVIPGKAGSLAGYVREGSGTFTGIGACSGLNINDSQTSADTLLPAGGDCKLDAGSDLVIWTKHFTQFVTYTNNPPSSTPSSASSSGGGGSLINYVAPTPAPAVPVATTPTAPTPAPNPAPVTPPVATQPSTATPTKAATAPEVPVVPAAAAAPAPAAAAAVATSPGLLGNVPWVAIATFVAMVAFVGIAIGALLLMRRRKQA